MLGPEDILAFWIGPPAAPLANASKWWKKDEAFDREIETRFGALVEQGARGELDGWKTDARGRVALVILLDQFSRNIFRGTARAFAQDARACAVTLEAIAAGDEEALGPIERSFLYMPFLHAEDVDLQHKGVAAFERLHTRAPHDLRQYFEGALGSAKQHAEIVERFGRFPHRNAVLRRASTAQETEFLKTPGSSF